MAKEEYYQRIVASLQSDITQLKSDLAELRKEIESLKVLYSVPQVPIMPKQTNVDITTLLNQVNDAIRKNFNKLPEWFADKEEFEKYQQTADTKFLSTESFASYCESLETRLKSIEATAANRKALFAINRHFHDLYTGPDCHPQTTTTFWEKWCNEILYVIGAAVIAGSFLLLNTINDNRHLREEKRLLYNTIELMQRD